MTSPSRDQHPQSEQAQNRPSQNHPAQQQASDQTHQAESPEDQVVDPQDLVRTRGIPDQPREVVTNPNVAPQMLNDPREDLRGDIMDEA